MKPILLSFKDTLSLLTMMAVAILLGSCIGSNSSNSYSSTNSNSLVQIGNISTIPSNGNSSDYALLNIQNNLNTTVSLNNIKIKINGKEINKTETSNYIAADKCLTIASKSSCDLKIFTIQTNNGYELQLTFKDYLQNTYKASQLISFNDKLPEQNGFIYSTDDTTISTNNGTTSIPFRLTQTYSKVEVQTDNYNSEVSCPNGYQQNSLCTALINNKPINQNTQSTSAKFTITGYFDDNQKTTTSSLLSLTNTNEANLVTSGVNVVINPANGANPVSITLRNNGNAAASQISISPVTPLSISSNTCGSTLSANATCTFSVNANQSTSGQSYITISYFTGSQTKVFTFNVSYVSSAPSPALTLTPSGSLSNISINGTSVTYSINITNSGTTTLNNLQLNSNLATGMSLNGSGTSCINGQSLYVGQQCTMVITYSPAFVTSGTVNFNATATYTDISGQSNSYGNSILSIPYSSTSNGIFKAVGDFGMVITSPSGGSGIWSANVNSPFNGTGVSGNSILENSGTFIMTMSNGDIKYSTLNGIFWNSSLLSNGADFNSSTCSVAYDGTNYYTCGTITNPFSATCLTSGRGCIVRTTNINESWTPVFDSTSAINNIYYFISGADKAYVATLAATTTNPGLATSIAGTSGWATTTTGQSSGNNNFSPVVFAPPGSTSLPNQLTAWNSTGYSSREPITTVTTPWTGNTTNGARPGSGTTSVRDALFQNNTYIITTTNGTSNGVIYSTDDPSSTTTGNYTARFSGSIPLNKIIYANGIGVGTYLVIGNNGANITTTTPTGTWTSQTALTTGQATSTNLTGAYYRSSANQIWVTGVNSIFRSTNATSWITPGLVSIAKYNNSKYLAVDNQGFIYASNDAYNWVQQTNPSGNILNSVYCARESTVCFAVGNNGTILRTTDGNTWSALTSGTIRNLDSMVCQNGTCIIVGGAGTATTGTVLSSTNYSSWTLVTSTLATTNLNNITYYYNGANSVYVAVGNTGTIFSSTNGTAWALTTSGANNLNSVACKNSTGCVIAGNAGTILFSATGTSSWSAATSGTTNDLLSVAFNTNFVAVGKGGILRTSATGSGTWTAATFPISSSTTNNLNAVISD